MIASRPALFPLIGLCAALAACSGKADKLSDAELARMLHTEGLADERVDAPAVDCLRAWAGDKGLVAGLPPALAGEPGKGDCRRHLQGWLDDGARNPQGLMFVDVATPKLARRAMDLLAALPPLPASARPQAPVDTSAPPPPSDIPAVRDTPDAVAEAEYERRVQINNTTNQTIDDYESTCREAQAMVGTRQFNAVELQEINQCTQRVAELRKQLSQVIHNGNAFEVSMATRAAGSLLGVLRSIIDRNK